MREENQLIFKLALFTVLNSQKTVEDEIVKLGILALLDNSKKGKGEVMNRSTFSKIFDFFASIFTFDSNDKQLAIENRNSDNVLWLELLHL